MVNFKNKSIYQFNNSKIATKFEINKGNNLICSSIDAAAVSAQLDRLIKRY